MRPSLKTLLLLGRVSNLPTVWSNCLAGWMLVGALHGHPGDLRSLGILCLGTTLLYLGGMYLNDAFDVAFDTAHRPERPIPSGKIRRGTVWALGGLWMATGAVVIFVLNSAVTGWALALAATILLYDAVHKRTPLALFLMAGCRVLIYPIAGGAAGFHTMPTALWAGAAAMGAWILSLSALARAESKPGVPNRANLLVLGIPIIIGLWLNGMHLSSFVPAILLLAWIARCATVLIRTRRAGPVVGDLLAGIPLVDLLLVSPTSISGFLPYLGCTVLALILRRSIPPS